MTRTNWEQFPYYIQLTPYEIVVGSNPGRTGHTDNATSRTHQEFLGGELHDIVATEFGETVLQEVITAIGTYVSSDTTQAVLTKDQQQLAAWRKIPIDESLLQLAAEAKVNGRDYFGYGPNGSTELKLTDQVTLTLPQTGDEAVFLHTDATVITRSIRNAPSIGYKGYAYIADIGLDIYDTHGDIVFTTGAADEGMYVSHGIGENYRIDNVLRNRDVILVEYSNPFMKAVPEAIETLGESGYLRVTPERGIISRAIHAA